MDYKELQSYMELSPFEVQFALTNIEEISETTPF